MDQYLTLFVARLRCAWLKEALAEYDVGQLAKYLRLTMLLDHLRGLQFNVQSSMYAPGPNILLCIVKNQSRQPLQHLQLKFSFYYELSCTPVVIRPHAVVSE